MMKMKGGWCLLAQAEAARVSQLWELIAEECGQPQPAPTVTHITHESHRPALEGSTLDTAVVCLKCTLRLSRRALG